MLSFSTGDEQRTLAIEHMALDYRQKIVGRCKRCGGTGRTLTSYDDDALSVETVDCRCMRLFKRYLEMMIAGVPLALIEDVTRQKLIERKVVEIDLATGDKMPPVDFIAEHVRPYVKKKHTVLSRGYSYLFIGTNSTGKTYAACKILDYYLRAGHTGHYIKFRALMKLINKSITEKGPERKKWEALCNEVRGVDLLIIDELGKETGSRDHIAGEIEEILKDRDAARMPVITISNIDYDDIVETYTRNIVGAFMRNYRALIFDPKNDMRKNAREQWYK